MRSAITIAAPRSALLLVDLQEEQRHDRLYSVEGIGDVLANAETLLRAARQHGLRVLHAAYKRDFAIVPPRPFEPRDGEGRATFSSSTSPLVEICSEVAPRNGEAVFVKNDASAFSEAGLATTLRAAGTEWVLIAGVWSEACVAATVRDAMAAGFRVLLVKDACGSGTVAMHETAILNLANRLHGGGVCDTARAVELMAGGSAEVWMPPRPAPILFTYESAAAFYRSL
jgi:nicotinamidase-related amidase